QWHNRLASVTCHNLHDAFMDEVERGLPRDRLKRARSFRSPAAHGMCEAASPVHEVDCVAGDLVADDACREWPTPPAAHFDNAVGLHRHREATGVGAVESANAGALLQNHGNSRFFSSVTPWQAVLRLRYWDAISPIQTIGRQRAGHLAPSTRDR